VRVTSVRLQEKLINEHLNRDFDEEQDKIGRRRRRGKERGQVKELKIFGSNGYSK
jgi:hypothetical protein